MFIGVPESSGVMLATLALNYDIELAIIFLKIEKYIYN